MRLVDMDEERLYYMEMINALAGLEDDLDANSSPNEAKSKLREVIDICRKDYNDRFSHN
jgi:hypothetical protein